MAVSQRRMGVLMRMRLPAVPIEIVYMMMVLVMRVAMGMRHRQVSMRVLMALLEMEPDTPGHQDRR